MRKGPFELTAAAGIYENAAGTLSRLKTNVRWRAGERLGLTGEKWRE
jgi:hypothetical protein